MFCFIGNYSPINVKSPQSQWYCTVSAPPPHRINCIILARSHLTFAIEQINNATLGSPPVSVLPIPLHLIIHWQGCYNIFLPSHYVLSYLQYQWHLLVISVQIVHVHLYSYNNTQTQSESILNCKSYLNSNSSLFICIWLPLWEMILKKCIQVTQSLTFSILENHYLYIVGSCSGLKASYRYTIFDIPYLWQL